VSVPTAYITAPPEAAADIAETLVEERLAACVNRLGCHSTYRWEGEIHEEPEVVLLAKTTTEGYDDLRERVLALHPHDVPCIERFDEDDVLDAFADWRAGVVGDNRG
jgi:periplasmic divalent cation tolerance protein